MGYWEVYLLRQKNKHISFFKFQRETEIVRRVQIVIQQRPSILRFLDCVLGLKTFLPALRTAVAKIKFAIFQQSCFPIDGYFSFYEPGKCDHLMGDAEDILRTNISVLYFYLYFNFCWFHKEVERV